MSDDRTLGAGRQRDHLRLGVDFGTVCRRCGARLLDEPVTTLGLTRHRSAEIGVAQTTEWQDHRLVLCDGCAAPMWARLQARFYRELEREGGGGE